MPKIQVDQKMVEEISLDELIDIQEGNLRALKSILGRFVMNGNEEYLAPEEGAAFIGKLKIRELKEISSGITKTIQNIAPNE